MLRPRLLAPFAALALSLAALSAGVAAAQPAPSAETAGAAKKAKKTTRIKAGDSQHGRVLFDDRGGALYLFESDAAGKSTCYGECAVEWPPFYARGKLEAGKGVKAKLLGKTTRSDGRRQVTYAGKPLYYWYADPPGKVYCHDVFEFGGDWLAVTPSGRGAK